MDRGIKKGIIRKEKEGKIKGEEKKKRINVRLRMYG